MDVYQLERRLAYLSRAGGKRLRRSRLRLKKAAALEERWVLSRALVGRLVKDIVWPPPVVVFSKLARAWLERALGKHPLFSSFSVPDVRD